MIATEMTQAELEDLHWTLGVLRGVAESTSSSEMRHRLSRVEQLIRSMIQEEPKT